jgi:tropomyosin
LESEHTSKDHEILSLQIRVKNLEEQAEKVETSLRNTTQK